MKKKFLAQYCEFHKTLKSTFCNTDGYTGKNSVEWRNDDLEPSGKNQSNLVTTLVSKVNSDGFLMSYLGITLTSE